MGQGAANAIATDARISIDLRLVPDQTPARARELVERHIAKQGYFLVREAPDEEVRRAHPKVALVRWDDGGYPAARTALDLPIAKAFLETLDEALGTNVVAMPTLGGSIPMHVFQEVLRTPIVGLPLANHDNNQHGADENIRIQNLWDGIEAYAGLIARLGLKLE